VPWQLTYARLGPSPAGPPVRHSSLARLPLPHPPLSFSPGRAAHAPARRSDGARSPTVPAIAGTQAPSCRLDPGHTSTTRTASHPHHPVTGAGRRPQPPAPPAAVRPASGPLNRATATAGHQSIPSAGLGRTGRTLSAAALGSRPTSPGAAPPVTPDDELATAGNCGAGPGSWPGHTERAGERLAAIRSPNPAGCLARQSA